MLRKEVDFVPLSPKKAQIAGLGVVKRNELRVPPLRLPTNKRTPSPLSRFSTEDTLFSDDEPLHPDRSGGNTTREDTYLRPRVRTTEEKKRTLGQLLGNVDALVEGVKSAGIWGLGE